MKKTSVSPLLILICSHAQAIPIQWKVQEGGNGNWYELIDASVSWTQAFAQLDEYTFNDANSHFVTIISAAENDLVTSLLFRTSMDWCK